MYNRGERQVNQLINVQERWKTVNQLINVQERWKTIQPTD